MSRYNKAWAAAFAQAVIQLAAAFVPFEPELEQALGVVLTAAIVWAVPNLPPPGPGAGAEVRLRSTAWAGFGAVGLALLLGACAGAGDRVADSLLGADCGPQSRAYRAEQLTGRLLARYPAVPAGALKAAVAGMQAAAAGGGDMTAAATAYQAALAGSLGPVLGASAGEPVLLCGSAGCPALRKTFWSSGPALARSALQPPPGRLEADGGRRLSATLAGAGRKPAGAGARPVRGLPAAGGVGGR